MNEILTFFQWLGSWNTNVPITTWVINNLIFLGMLSGFGVWVSKRTKTDADDSFWQMFTGWINNIKQGKKPGENGK